MAGSSLLFNGGFRAPVPALRRSAADELTPESDDVTVLDADGDPETVESGVALEEVAPVIGGVQPATDHVDGLGDHFGEVLADPAGGETGGLGSLAWTAAVEAAMAVEILRKHRGCVCLGRPVGGPMLDQGCETAIDADPVHLVEDLGSHRFEIAERLGTAKVEANLTLGDEDQAQDLVRLGARRRRARRAGH